MTRPLAQGGSIRVWVDPRRPERCVSDPELRYGRNLKATFILGFLGFFALVGAGKERLRRPPPAPRQGGPPGIG